MRVKIGDVWHEPTGGSPVMIELNESDRRNLANMAPSATRYASFADDETMTADEKIVWMNAGARSPTPAE